MNALDGTEPVADDELLYRRIPVSKGWYHESGLSPDAFYPRPDEETGISITRAKYKTIEEAARGKSKQGYFVAVLRAGELRRAGMEILPRPLPDDPGHAELPDLTCHNRDTASTRQRMYQLAKLAEREVFGPFRPTAG